MGPATPPSRRLRANPSREFPGPLHSADLRRMHKVQRAMLLGEPSDKYNFPAAASTTATLFWARTFPHCRLLSVRHALEEPTGFLTLHCPADQCQVLSRRCHASRGICSRTQQQHIILSGSAPGGIPLTRVAQPYPSALCSALATTLLA